MTKEKLLGTKYGIRITRPWNSDMYNHNEKVAKLMKNNIAYSLLKLYEEGKDEDFYVLCKGVCYYGFIEEYITEENYEVALEDLSRMQNHELNNEWPWLVKKGLVEEVDQQMVGYNK